MNRYSLLTLLALSACGPAEEPADAGFPLFPFPTLTNNGSGSSAGGGSGSSTDAGAIGGGSSSGGSSGSADAGVRVNLAEKVWLAQESVWRTSIYLRDTYGMNAVGWLRAAREAAGAQVTAGVLVESADGSLSYTSGGNTLRVTRNTGRTFVLKVYSLVGDITASNFPRAGESIDVSWMFSVGEARSVLAQRSSSFSGVFLSETDEFMDLDLQDSSESEVYSGPNSSGFYQTDIFGNQAYSGWIEFEDGRRVDLSTTVVFSTCVGSCGWSANQDYVYSHAVKLTMDGAVWNLNYTTGWTKQTPSSLSQYRWEGTIAGPVTGQLVKTPVGSAEALVVVIGSDRYTTRGVASP